MTLTFIDEGTYAPDNVLRAAEILKRSKRLSEFRNLKAEFSDQLTELKDEQDLEDEDWDYCEFSYDVKSKEDEAWDEYDQDWERAYAEMDHDDF